MPPDPLPGPAPLGARVETFRPMLSNTIAGFILSLLLVAGGCGVVWLGLRDAIRTGWNLPVWHDKDPSWAIVGLLGLLGLALAVGGVALVWYCWSLLSYRVEVYANGLRARTRGATTDVPWADVALIHEVVTSARLPILKGPGKLLVPRGTYTVYTVVTRAGAQHRFDENAIKSIRRFGRVLRETTEPLGVPWESVTHTA